MIYMKSHNLKSYILRLTLYLEIIIYIVFNYFDFITKGACTYSNNIKYFGILLCVFLAFIIGNNGYDKLDTNLLRIALIFTAFGDLCLLILGYYTLGIFLFCLVQITYIIRHNRGGIRKNIIFTYMTVITVVVLILKILSKLLYINNLNRSIIIISCIYSVLLIFSVYTAWTTFYKKFYTTYSCYLISIGMTLFLLCDINVALSNIMIFKSNIAPLLIWIFYLPSQVLLVLSGFKKLKI